LLGFAPNAIIDRKLVVVTDIILVAIIRNNYAAGFKYSSINSFVPLRKTFGSHSIKK